MKKYEFNIMKWNLEKYNTTPLFYQKFQILLLMENANKRYMNIMNLHHIYSLIIQLLMKENIFTEIL